MPAKKYITYFSFFLLYACCAKEENNPKMLIPPALPLEKILEKGTLDVSIQYNTTDYYVYRGITRGFHYELARDFAEFLGVKLNIVEVNNSIDSVIIKLNRHDYDLAAMSITNIPERKSYIRFSQPFFHTHEVLVQNLSKAPVQDLTELEGEKISILKGGESYRRTLQKIQDSLNIQFQIIEVEQHSYEDILHLVETDIIDYSVIDENIAQASAFYMKNIGYSIKLKENTAISWAMGADSEMLNYELDEWLKTIKKNGKLNMLYNRYFNNRKSVPQNTSKYVLLKKGEISAFDKLLKKESKRLDWDWRLLAAIVYTESNFDPEAESEKGAYGLMQVIPETAYQYKVEDYFQPDSNVYVGVQYLRYLNQYFSNHPIDPAERIKFILASYNAGAGHVLDAMRLAEKYGQNPHIWDNNVDYYIRHKNRPEFYRDSLAKNGYCNGYQTYNYVLRVLETYNNYKNINSYLE